VVGARRARDLASDVQFAGCNNAIVDSVVLPNYERRDERNKSDPDYQSDPKPNPLRSFLPPSQNTATRQDTPPLPLARFSRVRGRSPWFT